MASSFSLTANSPAPSPAAYCGGQGTKTCHKSEWRRIEQQLAKAANRSGGSLMWDQTPTRTRSFASSAAFRSICLPAALLTLLSAITVDVKTSSAAEKLSPEQLARWRQQIREALFVPEPLPPLEAEVHSPFEPEPGIVAERVSYGTQFGLRVSAILYRPKS